MSHELFRDVTDTRPRTGRAPRGTLAVSIVAHALILAAVIVVPLLATDALPAPDDFLPAYVRDALPPLPVAAPAVHRTPTPAPAPSTNPIPLDAPNRIEAEVLRQPVHDFTVGVVPPTGAGPLGDIGGTDVGVSQPSAPPPPEPAKPVRLSAYEMPRKVHDVAPRYPELAQRAGVTGIVIIEAVIAVDGTVRDARVLKSQPLLDHAALDAVKQWRYAPTRLGGVAVPVIVTVTVQFRLQR
jgi:protein TonB